MVNPTIQTNDARELSIFNAIFGDANIKRGAAGTLLKGTVLAFDETVNTYLPTQSPGTVGTDDNAKAIIPCDMEFAGTETLAGRIIEGGEIDENLLVFFDGDDTPDTALPSGDTIRTELRNYGITLRNVVDDSVLDNA